jgi:beta-lactamase superfamily II metal-dependent hydrolase
MTRPQASCPARKLEFMKRFVLGVLLLAGVAAAQKPRDLKIYFADVEGGQATLFVPPTGQSLLVDTGWPGFAGRDADRIVALCKQAGVTKIDNLVITHFHTDHVGGFPQLAARIPIARVIDHGDNTETNSDSTVAGWVAYQKTIAERHIARLSVKPGDVLPVSGMRVQVLSANGDVIANALPGAGAPNPACAASPMRPVENTENDRSVGMLITFGKLRILDMGDLTWAKERGLVCPNNKIGVVDIYIVSHHGMDRSSSPAFVKAIYPRVAIMDNGAHKGGSLPAWTQVEQSGRLEDLWQVHTAEDSDAAHNVKDSRIANLRGTDAGHSLELTARPGGSFAVTNERTGQTVEYKAR